MNIYHKLSGIKYIFLVLYVDDIILASNDLNLLRDTKKFLSNNSEMKDPGNASYVIGIQIYRDRPKNILGLSQKGYIQKLLQRYDTKDCKSLDTPIVKGDRLSLNQYPKNVLEIQEMEKVPFAQVFRNLIYAQYFSWTDIAYIVGVLGQYMSSPGMAH